MAYVVKDSRICEFKRCNLEFFMYRMSLTNHFWASLQWYFSLVLTQAQYPELIYTFPETSCTIMGSCLCISTLFPLCLLLLYYGCTRSHNYKVGSIACSTSTTGCGSFYSSSAVVQYCSSKIQFDSFPKFSINIQEFIFLVYIYLVYKRFITTYIFELYKSLDSQKQLKTVFETTQTYSFFSEGGPVLLLGSKFPHPQGGSPLILDS